MRTGARSLPYLGIVALLIFGPLHALGEEVPLTREGGVYHLPVRINGAIELPFLVDTGASDVHIPQDVARTLIRTGTITESDFLGTASYQMADGSVVENAKLNLRSLQIGSRTLTNVKASIGALEGSLLLGQTALGLLEPWQMDTTRSVFRFEEASDVEAQHGSNKAAAASYSGKAVWIYYAGELPPTENITPEAPLCYSWPVASVEEHLQGLKSTYPNLEGVKIEKNKDGSKTLVAKRKDETGKEIVYYSSTNPNACNEYQKKRLGHKNRGSNNESPSPSMPTQVTRTTKSWDKCARKAETSVDQMMVGIIGVETAILEKCGKRPVDQSGTDIGVGVHPYDLARSNKWKNRFTRVTKNRYQEFVVRLIVASPTSLENGWLVGSGISPHLGGSDEAAFAINATTGEVFAAMIKNGDQFFGFGFGNSWSAAPKFIQNWAVQHGRSIH